MSGRPTHLTDEIVAAARAYVDEFETYGHAVPSVVGLCKVIGRARSTVYQWAQNPDSGIADILEAINENQELETFNKALKGEYNATIAKLLLGKHGYHDKQDTEIVGKIDYSDISDTELDNRLKALLDATGGTVKNTED